MNIVLLVDINVFDEKFRNTIILSKIKGSNMIKRLLLFLSPFLGFPFAFAHVKPPQELLEKAIGGDVFVTKWTRPILSTTRR